MIGPGSDKNQPKFKGKYLNWLPLTYVSYTRSRTNCILGYWNFFRGEGGVTNNTLYKTHPNECIEGLNFAIIVYQLDCQCRWGCGSEPTMSFGPQAQDFLQKKVVNSLWFRKNIESLLIINYLSPKMDHVQQRGQTKTTLLALPEVKQKQKNKSICLFKSFLIQSTKYFGISRERESQNLQCTWSQRTTGAVDASNWGKQVKYDEEKIQNKPEERRNKKKKRDLWHKCDVEGIPSLFPQSRGVLLWYILIFILLTLTAAGKNQKNMLESKAGLTVIRPAWLEIVIRRKTVKFTGERNLVRKDHHIKAETHIGRR